MAQFNLSSIYTSDKYTSVLDLLKKLINNIDGVQYVGEDELSSLSSTVSGHTASISTLNTDYDALNSTVSGHTTSISTLNTNYDALNSTVSGHTTSISTLNSDYDALNSTVSGHTASITTLNSTVSGHTTSISSLNTSVDKNTADISSLTTTVSNIPSAYYTHNICILYTATDVKINVSISMLSTTSEVFDLPALAYALHIILKDDNTLNLNCLCLYNGSNVLNNNIYSSITFSSGDWIITLMSDPLTPSSITFNLHDATVTDSVTSIY